MKIGFMDFNMWLILLHIIMRMYTLHKKVLISKYGFTYLINQIVFIKTD